MKKKIITYSIILILLIGSISVSVVAILAKNQYKNNEVSFVVENDDAYCSIEGTYYYNDEIVADKKYEKISYTQEVRYSDESFSGFKLWNIGDSNFDLNYDGEEMEKFTYQVDIANLNDTKALNITLSDVAVGESGTGDEKEILFYTTIICVVGNNETILFCNKENALVNYDLYKGQQKVSITSDKIGALNVGENISLKILAERKTMVTAFEFVNNFKINIATAN